MQKARTWVSVATLWILLVFCAPSLKGEHVILCGGPALRGWEDLRVKRDQHDRWWANFIRASTIQMDITRKAYGPTAKIVWIVYKPGYVMRGREDGEPYTEWIQEQASKRQAELRWVSTSRGAIGAINSQAKGTVKSFFYFGHSNRYAFLLDYGCEIMAASKCWIHENDLRKIKKSIFAPNALCQSYGCHTGESMSQVWNRYMGGIRLIGAKGKTGYEVVGQGKLPSIIGTWIR